MDVYACECVYVCATERGREGRREHLDTREGDGRGGIGANHQGKDGRSHIPKHVWQLNEREEE